MAFFGWGQFITWRGFISRTRETFNTARLADNACCLQRQEKQISELRSKVGQLESEVRLFVTYNIVVIISVAYIHCESKNIHVCRQP